jgi:hypothetical protein
MTFDGIFIALILGFIRGGSLRSFADIRLKFGWVFPVLLAFEVLIFLFENSIAWVGEWSNYLIIIVYLIGLGFLWMNRHQQGFLLIFIGVLLNFLVIAFNVGRMPVSLDAALIVDPEYKEILQAGLYAKHQVLTDGTVFRFLGDIIPLPNPYPLKKVMSLGDVVMNIGVFIFIQNLMLNHKKKDDSIGTLEEATS